MSQHLHHGIFSFSSGFDHQIRRDYEQPQSSLVGIQEKEDEEEDRSSAVYETAGMLSEMFNFPLTAAELLDHPNYLRRQEQPIATEEWYGNRQGGVLEALVNSKTHNDSRESSSIAHQNSSNIDADSAAAMQLFVMKPQQPTRSASYDEPNPSFNSSHEMNPPPSQGLSLSLCSAKVEEMRMGDHGRAVLYFNQGGGASYSSAHRYNYHPYNKNIIEVGLESPLGVLVNVMRSSKYVKPAQQLLLEFCSVERGHFNNNNPNTNPAAASTVGGGGGSKDHVPPLSAADRIEHQRRKIKLLSMLDEVDRRYNHYCSQMQMVVKSFDLVMGLGAAVPYTALAQKAMSRHFRCLKEAIAAQVKQSCELLGEKEGSSSGVTKGETPRLKLLEQRLRLRQQRAFHQMGMMDQEDWRPQRGLPERSVNILRAWLFEHFLHPYPSDADKHRLARQTGLSRNQVSNWFINARVRLWKPMVEHMYQQEAKEEEEPKPEEQILKHQRNLMLTVTAQTPTPYNTYNAAAESTTTTGKISEIMNAAADSDPSVVAINRHFFSENQALVDNNPTTADAVAPPLSQAIHDTCRAGTTSAALIGSSSSFGTTAVGDVSLTLGLRHSGHMAPPPENSPFSLTDLGGY